MIERSASSPERSGSVGPSLSPADYDRLTAVFVPRPLEVGTLVDYHGSVTAAHGRFIVAVTCECTPCLDNELTARLHGLVMTPRYQLTPVSRWLPSLEHVRHLSVTPATEGRT